MKRRNILVDDKYMMTTLKQKVKDAQNKIAEFYKHEKYAVVLLSINKGKFTGWISGKDLSADALKDYFMFFIDKYEIKMKKEGKRLL
jgi:hypothetical protein